MRFLRARCATPANYFGKFNETFNFYQTRGTLNLLRFRRKINGLSSLKIHALYRIVLLIKVDISSANEFRLAREFTDVRRRSPARKSNFPLVPFEER